MGTTIVFTKGVQLEQRKVLEQHWREDKFGPLTDEKLELLAVNVHAIHEGRLYDDIEHVLNVWEECGIQ